MTDIFKDKSEMLKPGEHFAVSPAHLRPDFLDSSVRMPGERRDKDMQVKNLEPRKRGCHY